MMDFEGNACAGEFPGRQNPAKCGGGEDQLGFFARKKVIDVLSSEDVVGTESFHRFKGKLAEHRGEKSTQELLNI